ncbi:10341_t:CDS:2 [Gigaspora margarita]|uniref:10341_t:CDS:1 n=1 Tax=Gigaspora margarita TaxID=4874 RepID=A0ABN7USR4_GIGMA|nr:10341_t:CDS:2 [Gigaspora margarita]
MNSENKRIIKKLKRKVYLQKIEYNPIRIQPLKPCMTVFV